jgi:hypothetical protein
LRIPHSATPGSRLADPSAPLVFIELVMPLVMQALYSPQMSSYATVAVQTLAQVQYASGRMMAPFIAILVRIICFHRIKQR